MKVINLNRNVLNIQKCLLPDSTLVTNHCGRYAFISIPDKFEIIVQIGLCKHKQIDDTCWMDTSVIKFFPSYAKKERVDLPKISINDLKIIPSVEKAKLVHLTIVFNNVLDLKRHDNELLKLLLKEILKLFVFSVGSVVFLNNLLQSQNLGLYCIVVNLVGNGTESDLYRVAGATTIIIQKKISKLKYEQSQKVHDIYIGGCDKIYRLLKESMEFSQFSICRKLLLIGSPGCGKTSLVKKIARDCDFILLQVIAPDINVSQPGETEKKLKEIFIKAQAHAKNEEKCLILIDEIDSICMKNDDNTSSVTKRTIRQLIILLEEIKNIDGIVVIATTNSPDELDSQLRRSNCFENEIEISMPDQSERMDIIKNLLEFYNVNNCSDEIISEVSAWTPGFVGADLNLIVLEAKNLFEKTNCNEEKLKDCFKQAVSKATPSSLKGAIGLQSSKATQFSDIGGLDKVISLLNFSVKQQLLNPEVYRRLGIPLTKGILLYGPPGCAKTTLVKALAKECNTTFLAVSAADLFSPFVGDAERLVLKLFSQARTSAPAIIFIDEIDAIVGSKSGREKGVQERVLSALLIEMDGVGIKVESSFNLSQKIREGDPNSETSSLKKTFKDENNSGIIVIGATNRPELIDDALLRPGRFDKLVYVPCPNETQRFEILKKVSANMPLDESVNLKLISKLTEYYSGADLKNLCMEAGLQLLTDEGMNAKHVKQEQFESVLKKIQPSLNKKHLTMYENFKKK